jgi:hypothetical protein
MEIDKRDMTNNLEEAILMVIVFFDMFDYPLTSFEIWKFLNVKCELYDVLEVLVEIKNINFNNVNTPTLLAKRGQQKNGFYFLAGREEIADLRVKRYNIADRKFKRAILIGRVFKIIPWIKMLAVGNIMGSNNSKDESDIDLFIISQKNRVWITRFFCVSIIKIFGIRPTTNNVRDKICLSFFVDEAALDLSGLMLDANSAQRLPSRQAGTRKDFAGAEQTAPSHPMPVVRASELHEDDIPVRTNPLLNAEASGGLTLPADIYFIYWLANLTPIHNIDDIYEKLIAANPWLRECLPNWEPIIPADKRSVGKNLSGFYYDLVEMLFGGLEKFFRNWQIKILPAGIKDKMNLGTDVIVNEHVLKMHTKDRRGYYRRIYEEKLSST